MPEEFVSEAIRPMAESMDTSAMATGCPGFPQRFSWRDKEYTLDQILETWKESGACRSGSSEVYLRKHWFKIRTTDGAIMKIYFERQARSKRDSKKRWWLHTVVTVD